MGIASLLLNSWLLLVGIVVGVILILGIVFLLVFGLRSKRENQVNRVVIDEQFISDLLAGLGQLANIENVCIDNGRVKFKVVDLDVVNGDALKELSTSGVFITGNNVKLLFKYDSNSIMEELIARGVSKC